MAQTQEVRKFRFGGSEFGAEHYHFVGEVKIAMVDGGTGRFGGKMGVE